MFPVSRPRRLRSSEKIRDLVSETSLDTKKLIMPVFVDETARKPVPIPSMPGIARQTLDSLAGYLGELEEAGVSSILLFGIPGRKDDKGTSAHQENGVVQESIRIARKETSQIVIADLCMCEYTSHGHCGVLHGEEVDNDSTLDSYGKIALSYAKAGVHMVAPSGMMDGQVGFIRETLDGSGYQNVPIMAYSAKYASAMYGPFRNAADSTPSFGDRRAYQMDPRNSREAMLEIAHDLNEGADIIMVKPALPYLDIINKARESFDAPIAAYSVSGEYTMLKMAVDNGYLAPSAIEESITSIFRAGADMVITYFAEYLCEKSRK